MSTQFRAQIYRDVAHLLRQQAAASTPEIQKEMEATARQYDLLAESVEMLITAVEAWDWINEQESVNKFAAHEAKGQKGKRCRSPDA